MAKIILIAEKPSASRNMAKALLGGKMSGQVGSDDLTILALRGHLYEFVDPEKQVPANVADLYKTWNTQNLPWDWKLFNWKMQKKKDTASLISDIKQQTKGVDEIICATDDDISGEGTLLWAEVIEQNNISAPKFSRMYFEDESEKSIQKAFNSRVVIPDLTTFPELVKAKTRAKWDFLSMQWTRIATECSPIFGMLRQGRLKSAMVKIVGEQLDSLSKYKKVPFYQNRFRDENGVVYTNPDEPTYPKKDEVPKTYQDAHVVLDSKEDKATKPPKLMDLATLSARLAPKGIDAKTVLATYQKMYENQLVSYPRTDDKKITQEQFDDLLPKVDAIANLVGVDVSHLTHRQSRPSHIGKGMAHGANRPGPNVPASLLGLDQEFGKGAKEIYVLLAKNYLAMLCEDYIYEQQKGHLQEYPDFKGVINVAKSKGWKAIYSADDDEEADADKGLGTIAKPFVHEGFPPKPATPTMKWLMKQLEKWDVGTGATRTSTYSDVTNQKTKYPLLKDDKGKISMTEYGDVSYRLLPDTHIGDLKITEKLFSDMKKIEKGELDPDVVLDEVAVLVKEDLEVMRANAEEAKKGMKTMSKEVEEVERVEGLFVPDNEEISFKRVWQGHRFTDEEVEKLLAGEEIIIPEVIWSKSKKIGKDIHGCVKKQTFNDVEYYGFAPNFDIFPKEICQHTFTEDEAKALQDGETIYVEGLISKKGNKFNANLTWKNNKINFEFD